MTKIKKFFPIIFLVLVSAVFFYKFFLSELIPIPADITVGRYYPWLNQKWGNTVGVPVGSHQVIFTYFPNSFKYGLFIMLIASTILVFLYIKLKHA